MIALKEENLRLYSKAEEVVKVERALNALQDEFDRQQRSFVNESTTCKNCLEKSKENKIFVNFNSCLFFFCSFFNYQFKYLYN